MNESPKGIASHRIAVILPCFNEGAAVADVVSEFRTALPTADVFVFDNNSTDETVSEALRAGAQVRHESRQGKGYVVRNAFAQIEADIFVMADGDGTYDASRAPELVAKLIESQLEMVVGTRRATGDGAFRSGHQLGNRVFNFLVAKSFGSQFTDVFSGYRVFSNAFAKSFPAIAVGFETESEMTVHAIQLGLPTAEVETAYGDRTDGTESKLRTYSDGFRILGYVARLLRYVRPFLLFGVIAGLITGLSLLLGLPVVFEFIKTGLVPRVPTAIAAASLLVMAGIAMVTAVILDSISFAQLEQKRLAFLAAKSAAGRRRRDITERL